MKKRVNVAALLILAALSSLANANFVSQSHRTQQLDNFIDISWHRVGDTGSLELKHWFKPEHLKSLWGGDAAKKHFGQKPNLDSLLPDFPAGVVIRHHGKWGHKHWSKCDTSEVPLPAALPLFSFALLGLGLVKRRRQ